MFSTPEQILERYEDFRFSDEQLAELERTMPIGHVSTPERALSLNIWYTNLRSTFAFHRDWIGQAHGTPVFQEHEIKTDKDHLRLVGGATPRSRSVGWTVLDLTANRGLAPTEVDHPKRSSAFAVMAAAALHPEWVAAMDGQEVPYVWLHGLEINVEPGTNRTPWQHVPMLGYLSFKNTVFMAAMPHGTKSSRYATPVEV